MSEFGPFITYLIRLPITIPKFTTHCIQGQVKYIDKYGNLITDIDQSRFREYSKKREFKIRIKDITIRHLSSSYEESKKGRVLAIFNSFNLLELAIYKGNAAEELAISLGTKVEIEWSPN